MQRLAYIDGAFIPYEDARIPLDDRSLFFGDAVYDACLGMHGRIHALREHIGRFFTNAALLRISYRCTEEELSAILRQAASFFEAPCFLYMQLSRTSPQRIHTVGSEASSRLLITVTPSPLPDGHDTVRLVPVTDNRYGLCAIKTVNLLPNVLAATSAAQRQADEAVFIKDGYVTECSHSNIFILKDGVLITRPTDGTILPGITRARLISCAEALSMPVKERAFTLAELTEADDILITSSSKLCRRATLLHAPDEGVATEEAVQLCRAMREDFFSEVGK